MSKNGLVKELWLISKFMTSQTEKYIITIHIYVSYRTVPSEYNMSNIFRVSHILLTRIKAREIKANMRNKENTGHIVRDKRMITSLSLT